MALSHPLNGSSILQRGLFKKASSGAQAGDARLVLSTFRDPYFVQFTVFLVAYCIAGKLGQATTNIRSSNLGPVWPAYGIALAAFLMCGYRIWPAVALGAFSIAFFSPVTHLAALGQAAGATLAASIGAFFLQRVAHFEKSLSRLRDALALVVLGALGSALVSASIGTSVLYATRVHAYSGLGSAWLIYWLGDATGVLLLTPVALTLPRFLRIRDRIRITELVVLFVLLTGACFLIFGDLGLIPVRLHVLAFAVLPFVMWAAVRFGVTGAGCGIDRAALGSTVIGRGTKIDDLVAIGHNTRIGPNGLVVALTGIAGSVTVGHHVTLAGQVGIAGHLKIGDNVTIGAQAGVVNHVPDQSTLLGSPAMPISQARRVAAIFVQLPELNQRVKRLEQQVEELSSPEGQDNPSQQK